MGVIDLDLQGQLAVSTPNSRKWHSTSLLHIGLGLLLNDCIEFKFNFQLETKYQNAIVSGSAIKLKGGKEQPLQKIISIMDNLSMCCTECIVGMKLIILKHNRFSCIRYSLITNNIELGYDFRPSGVKPSPEVSIDRPRSEWILTDKCCPRNIYFASKLQGTLSYCCYFPLYCPPSLKKYKMKKYIHE